VGGLSPNPFEKFGGKPPKPIRGAFTRYKGPRNFKEGDVSRGEGPCGVLGGKPNPENLPGCAPPLGGFCGGGPLSHTHREISLGGGGPPKNLPPRGEWGGLPPPPRERDYF